MFNFKLFLTLSSQSIDQDLSKVNSTHFGLCEWFHVEIEGNGLHCEPDPWGRLGVPQEHKLRTRVLTRMKFPGTGRSLAEDVGWGLKMTPATQIFLN